MIPAYQMHNILKAFTKNLLNDGTASRLEGSKELPGSRQADSAAEGKRQVVAQKLAAVIMEKIARTGSGTDRILKPAMKNRDGDEKCPDPPNENGARFTYTSLDGNGVKRTLTRIVKESDLMSGSEFDASDECRMNYK